MRIAACALAAIAERTFASGEGITRTRIRRTRCEKSLVIFWRVFASCRSYELQGRCESQTHVLITETNSDGREETFGGVGRLLRNGGGVSVLRPTCVCPGSEV